MEVPFLSSGAISREYYSLVQSVEAASTLQEADDILVHKVDIVRRRFKRQLTSSECIPSLVLLLYCWTATSLGQVTRAMLEFALPHALTLAEAGSTLKAKRIGYQFCTEVMEKSDELQVMLVNTLRKDIASSNPARICLALDVLLTNYPMEAIPALTPSLMINLLAHDSLHVKRKAMALVRMINRFETGILMNVHGQLRVRLEDRDLYTNTVAALRLLEELSRAHIVTPSEALKLTLADCYSSQSQNLLSQRPRLQLVEVIGKLGCELLVIEPDHETINDTVNALLGMVECATHADQGFIFECFRAISRLPISILKPHFSWNSAKALSLLGRLINSHKPNTQYFVLTCLLELDAVLWAGTADEIPPVFDEGQVHTIMGFLDSSDNTIRVKTLHVLYRVDGNILLMHLTQLMSAFPTSTPLEEQRLAERVLEVSAAYERDGGAYVRRLCELCTRMSHQKGIKGKRKATNGGTRLISETVLEQVLLHLKRCPDSFREAFVDAASRIPVSDAGPTLTVIIAATVCEYGALSTISQNDLLESLAARLEANPPAIQEALLLAILRTTARCELTTTEVTDQVQRLHQHSGSAIRHRCDQFLTYSEQISSLRNIVERAKSDTLPDFLLALETAELHTPTQRAQSSQASTDSEHLRSPSTRGKLRYEAYERPSSPPPRLTRRGSSVDSHATSSHSDLRSPHSHSRDTILGIAGEDSLSRTMTAGDLALAAHEHGFSRPHSINTSIKPKPSPRLDPVEDLMSKTDLIALDSPFIGDPSQPIVSTGAGQDNSVDFEVLWDALKDQRTTRGWSQRSIKDLESHVQGLSTAYTVASLPSATLESSVTCTKLALSSLGSAGVTIEPGLLATVRLRSGEEDTSLWQMRCLDATLTATLRGILDDA